MWTEYAWQAVLLLFSFALFGLGWMLGSKDGKWRSPQKPESKSSDSPRERPVHIVRRKNVFTIHEKRRPVGFSPERAYLQEKEE